MTKIYIIRHAEAEGNLYRRAQGHFNGKVTRRGKEQIEALAERFRDIKIDAVYASDLERTQETAGAILRHNPDLKLNIDTRLKEVCMGVWENQMWGNIEIDYPEQMKYFNADPEKWSVEGSEAHIAVGDRMLEVVKELGEKHDGQTIALFSHGVAIRALHCRMLNIPSNENHKVPHADNTNVNLYTWDNGKVEIEFRSDNSHLTKENSTFARQTWWVEKEGGDLGNLSVFPIDLSTESQLFVNYFENAWEHVYGTLDGFDVTAHLANAKTLKNPEDCLVKICRGGVPIGMIKLDLDYGEDEDFVHISLIYLEEEYRKMGLGIQLLGQAVHVAKLHGRSKIRLHVSPKNENAIGFYKHQEFKEVGSTSGAFGSLMVLEKVI